MRFSRKPETRMPSESPSGKRTSVAGPSRVVKGVRVPTSPGARPKRRTLVTMSPEALKLICWRFYHLGFNDTGAGFHGESFKNKKLTPGNIKALRGILNARFLKAYASKEEP